MVRADPDKYEKDFDAVVAFLTQYIGKKATMPSVKVAVVGQNRLPSGRRPVLPVALLKKVELKKYSREKYDSMSMVRPQKGAEL